MLRDLGSNAIRMSHTPPAAEVPGQAGRMGFLAMLDWAPKAEESTEFHLIFKADRPAYRGRCAVLRMVQTLAHISHRLEHRRRGW